MTCLRSLVACLVVAGHAAAQPSADPFEACKAQRRELTAEAMQVTDASERGRRLAAMPICVRNDDGTVAVEDPRAPNPTAATAVRSHGTLDLSAGVEGALIRYQVRQSSGFAPCVDLAAAWHHGVYLVGAFADVAAYDDPSYLGQYNVRHWFYELGARAGIHLGDFEIGGGIGVVFDDGVAFADVPGRWDELPLLEVDSTYTVRRGTTFDLLAHGIVSFAATTRSSNDLSLYGDVASLRAAIAVRWH